MPNYTEKKIRAIVKAITWRITATLDTFLIAFIITHEFSKALQIGIFEIITKTLIYYVHERIWNRAKFGRIVVKDIDYQI